MLGTTTGAACALVLGIHFTLKCANMFAKVEKLRISHSYLHIGLFYISTHFVTYNNRKSLFSDAFTIQILWTDAYR